MFTRPWDGFAAPNPPYNEAQLDPYKQQVIDHLQPLASICDGDSAATSYIVRALAIELAIGSPLDMLDSLSCSYVVTGRLISPAGDVVAGVPITVDAPGLTGCTTTSTSTGSYTCALAPASAELNPAPSFPLPVTVEARWADDGTVAATGAPTFTTKASFNTAASTTADLVIDDSSLPRISLSGTMTDVSGGVPGPVDVILVGYDANGLSTARNTVQVMPDAVTGVYDLSLIEPRGTTELHLFVHLGVTQFTQQFHGIHAGQQDLQFSIDHRPTTLSIGGTMLNSGVPFHGPMLVSIEAFGDSDQLIQVIDSYVDIDQTTGGYILTRELSSAARSALITVLIGSNSSDWKRLSIPTLTPGVQQVQFDVDVRPTFLVLSGQLSYLGSPVDGLVDITAETGGRSFVTQLFAIGGQYSGTVRLPDEATQVHVVVTLTSDNASTVVTRDVTLIPGTVNNATWDIDVSSLTVQGTASIDGVPLADARIPVDLELLGATDQPVASIFVDIVTDANGAYSFQVPMDSRAQTAELAVFFDANTTRVYRLTGLHPGAINRTLDVDPSFALSLTLHGRVLDEQGAPQAGNVDVHVDFIDVSGAVADVLSTSNAQLDADGYYVLSVPLPQGMTHARVELLSNGQDENWVVVVPLSGSVQEQVFDVNRQAPRIQLIGNILATDGCIPSRVEPRLILIAFPTDPVGAYDPVTFDWAGGTRVYDSDVIADPATGLYGVSAALPAGTTRVAIIQVQTGSTSVATLTVDPTQVWIYGWDLLVC